MHNYEVISCTQCATMYLASSWTRQMELLNNLKVYTNSKLGLWMTVNFYAYVLITYFSLAQPPTMYLTSCRALLKELSHSDLQSVIIPAVHKSLLRNPEAVLTALAALAAGTALDLSPYLAELAKLLQGQYVFSYPGICQIWNSC